MRPGERRHRLTFMGTAPPSAAGKSKGTFQCDCGKFITAQVGNVRSGNTKSCGCQRIQHGQNGSPIYKCWENMKVRARKVGMDERWLTFAGFLASPPLAGASPIDGQVRSYEPGLCLCRTNDEGPYSPENCRWDTRSNNSTEQQRKAHA